MVVYVNGERVRIRTGQNTDVSQLPLATISPNTMDIMALVSQCKEHQIEIPSVLDLVTTDILNEYFSEIPDSSKQPAPSWVDRGGFLEEDISLLNVNTIQRVKEGITLWLHCFKIPKKDNKGSRFLVDGRTFDDLLKQTSFQNPAMGLPRIDIFIKALLKYKLVATRDATSFFYQIEIPPNVRKWFGLRFGAGKRGSFCTAVMKKLPMGVCFSPSLAQGLAGLVCSLIKKRLPHLDFFAEPWVDNFIFAANSQKDLDAILATFQAICDEINLICKPVETVNDQGWIEILGLMVQPGTKVWCNIDVDRLKATASDRDLLQKIGHLMWCNYTVGRTPLCKLPTMMDAMREACKRQSWDANLRRSTALIDEIETFALSLSHATLTLQDLEDVSADIQTLAWSDASGKLLAGIIQHDLTDVEWYKWPTPSSLHRENDTFWIYIAEAMAWSKTVIKAHQRGLLTASLLQAIDNLGLVKALQKGHSGNKITDAIMAITFPFLPPRSRVAWVETKRQRADMPSRDGTPTDQAPWIPNEFTTVRWIWQQ